MAKYITFNVNDRLYHVNLHAIAYVVQPKRGDEIVKVMLCTGESIIIPLSEYEDFLLDELCGGC